MATETVSTSNPTTESLQEANIRNLLLCYLKQKGYKLLKDEAPAITDKKENIIAVSRHGRKELIEVKGFSAFHIKQFKEEQPKKSDQMLQAIQSIAEALFFSFNSFGKYFKGEKVALALALPDTERYRQIIKNLEDYFTDNDLDFKVYLVAEEGGVKERNLNEKMNKNEIPTDVMEERKKLRLE